MPMIVNSLILGLLTERTPWLLRPIVRFVTNKLRAILVEPGLRTYGQMARTADTSPAYAVTDPLSRSRNG